MRSVIFNKYGGPDVLELTDIDIPELPEDKILIKVFASSVNPIDYKIRKGDMKIFTGKKFPKYAGSDFAGVIEEAEVKVDGYQKGDKVYGFLSAIKGGAYSEFLIADPAKISLMPEKFNFEEAASIPLAALTALQALNYKGNISEGSKVLINGATGGVGSFGIQIAKAMGAEVTGICSEKNIELCKKLGADKVYDYSSDELKRSGDKFDLFFDAAAKLSFSKSKKYLNSGGVYITTVPGPGVMLRRLFNIIPFTKKAKMILVKPSGVDLTILTGFAMTGEFHPIVENIFDLDKISDAHKLAESGKFRGKIVVKIN